MALVGYSIQTSRSRNGFFMSVRITSAYLLREIGIPAGIVVSDQSPLKATHVALLIDRFIFVR